MKLRRLKPSATLAMNEKSRRLAAEGRTVYRLGFGQSPFPPPTHVIEALRANAAQKDYLPVKGLESLRAAVAEFHRERYGIEATAEDILIGPGSKELMFLTQLAYQGELLLPSPSWVSYAPQAQLLGLPVRWLACRKEDRWQLTAETLDEVCRVPSDRPRLLILNSPNNPTGQSFGIEELEALAAVARAHRLLVISDEIYGETHHAGAHRSLAECYPEGTIISGGLSKWAGAGGWRLGTFCFPAALRELLDAVACGAGETFSSVSAPIQYAAVTAYRGGAEIDAYLAQSRRILRAVGRWTADRLNEMGVETVPPDGGFYVFPDFTAFAEPLRARGITTSAELCERLLEEAGVALLPGADFGRPLSELTCRLAFVDFNGEACLAAAAATEELDEAFLREQCGKMVAAMEALRQWLGR